MVTLWFALTYGAVLCGLAAAYLVGVGRYTGATTLGVTAVIFAALRVGPGERLRREAHQR